RRFCALPGTSEVRGGHSSERSTPVEEPSRVNTDRRSQVPGAADDRVEVARLPEEQVDGVEGRVAESRTRVDGDQATPLSSVEDVDRCEVAMQQHRRGRFLGKPEGQLSSAVEQLVRD